MEGALSDVPDSETDEGVVNWKLILNALLSEISIPIATTIAKLSILNDL